MSRQSPSHPAVDVNPLVAAWPPFRRRSRAGSIAATLAFALLPVASGADGLLLQPGFDQLFLDDVGVGFGRNRAYGVAVAKFDGDDINDIVSGDTAGDVHLFTGVGDGTFADRGVVINAGFHDAYGLAAEDFDGDGNQDVVLSFTNGTGSTRDGELHLYLGNGDGTFQATGFPQLGFVIGDGGTDVMTLAAGDVDNDGDVDLISGDITSSANGRADVLLFRNRLVEDGVLAFVPETVISAANLPPDPDSPPYFPPTLYLHAFGLAVGDVDGDTDLDLLVGDRANYLYIYENDGTGSFTPVRYNRISTRPYAFNRLHANFTRKMSIATGDLNGDGILDFVSAVQTGDNAEFAGEIDLWLGVGPDGAGRPDFVSAGVIGAAGTDPRGLAVGSLNPADDAYTDVVFGTFEGDLYGLFADLTDTDGDGIIDRFDNAPDDYNPPLIDMNTDGALNRLDQLDADHDTVGDPADDDDDNDGVPDDVDNCPLTPNDDQADFDLDGRGDACDPLNDADLDADGVLDGPIDMDLYARARAAKARWARSDTHFILRVDALSRVFQNEFTQTLIDGATLDPVAWELKKAENYNGIGDDPAVAGYNVPSGLPGGADVPLTVVVIPRLLWDAFGDDDPIRWINDRNANPNLEIALHGTYHANNVPTGDWADLPDRDFFSCETCGHPMEAIYQLLRIGVRTLRGDYALDPWILDSGVNPGTAPYIDWSDAANPLLSYAPPFNASDTPSRDATARLGFLGFSASVFEEESPIFAPEGSSHEMFDAFGMFHASADRQVDPEAPPGMEYGEYLDAITQYGGLNTWLIEEVEWSTRYCNDRDRLAPCAAAPDNVNRENNMVDGGRWAKWLMLLEHAKASGEVMTLGDYSLAVATDNCPAIVNPSQADVDADGVGDRCDVDRIDIMPGSDDNVVNLRGNGVVPLAILGSEALDVTNVDVTTLRFGPAGAVPAHALEIPEVYVDHLTDVDGDGFVDLVSHYRVSETGIAPGDTSACLTGVIGATSFEACDGITTRPQ